MPPGVSTAMTGSSRSRSVALGALTLATVTLVGFLGADLLSGGRAAADRRFLIYAMARHLRAGMTPAEVSEILDLHSAPFLVRRRGDQRQVVRARTGPAQYCLLEVRFSPQGRLVAATIRGEDGELDRFDDAPADIP